jgi:predicted RNA binding protein YcfA (HicA-like mRNA interferase family)
MGNELCKILEKRGFELKRINGTTTTIDIQ